MAKRKGKRKTKQVGLTEAKLAEFEKFLRESTTPNVRIGVGFLTEALLTMRLQREQIVELEDQITILNRLYADEGESDETSLED